jgi:RNA-binding protein YlmH
MRGVGQGQGVNTNVTKLAERAERAARQWDTCTSGGFLDPKTWTECERYFKRRADVRAISFGGYPNAERRLLLMGSAEVLDSTVLLKGWEEEYVTALSIRGNFKFDKKKRSHRHVLGSMLGLGIERSVIGDILVPETETETEEDPIQALVSADMADFLCSNFTHIARIPVRVEEVALAEIRSEPEMDQNRETFVKSVSSSRLDSVTSVSFKLSRSKVVDAIKRGEVSVNWEPCLKPGAPVQEGDVITFRGKGRAKIQSIQVNHRDRTLVEFSLFT